MNIFFSLIFFNTVFNNSPCFLHIKQYEHFENHNKTTTNILSQKILKSLHLYQVKQTNCKKNICYTQNMCLTSFILSKLYPFIYVIIISNILFPSLGTLFVFFPCIFASHLQTVTLVSDILLLITHNTQRTYTCIHSVSFVQVCLGLDILKCDGMPQ